jgi:hypothetical protein
MPRAATLIRLLPSLKNFERVVFFGLIRFLCCYDLFRVSLLATFGRDPDSSIQIRPMVLDRLDPYFSGEDSLASNKGGAFLP